MKLKLTVVLALLFGLSFSLSGNAAARSPEPAHARTDAGTAPPPAQPAGTSCDWTGCSETINESRYPVFVARDWCTNPGRVCTASPTRWLGTGGDRTPPNEDWDAFRVDAGWCFKVLFKPQWALIVYDQRGRGDRWVRVRNPEEAVVKFQSPSTCSG